MWFNASFKSLSSINIMSPRWSLKASEHLHIAVVLSETLRWRDLKTMEFYFRVAGVEEKGATDCLKILPSEAEVMGNVVELFKH